MSLPLPFYYLPRLHTLCLQSWTEHFRKTSISFFFFQISSSVWGRRLKAGAFSGSVIQRVKRPEKMLIQSIEANLRREQCWSERGAAAHADVTETGNQCVYGSAESMAWHSNNQESLCIRIISGRCCCCCRPCAHTWKRASLFLWLHFVECSRTP